MINVYFKYKQQQLKKLFWKWYEYPAPTLVLFTFLTVYLLATNYRFAASISLFTSLFIYFFLDYKKGDHIAWHRKQYRMNPKRNHRREFGEAMKTIGVDTC